MSDLRDVLVVGGGPAGSAVACFLRGLGRDVLLLDEARFPRDKVCGESVSPEAWRLLDAMGATPSLLHLSPQPLHGMRVFAADGTGFRGAYGGRERVGFALRRLQLDALLLRAARASGAEVREGVRVASLRRRAGRVVGIVDAQGDETLARVVIGADGRRSVVARQLGLLREHPRLRRFAVRGHWSRVEGLEPFGEMHVCPGGYCGVAPLSPTTANVTFVLDMRQMAAAAGDLDGFYRRQLRWRWPALAERLSRAELCEPPKAIGPLALQSLGVAAPGALLLGDAAGFYDPFTGEGITLALRSAELAARAADEALRQSAARPGPGAAPNAQEAWSRYEQARRRTTRDKFRFNRTLQLVLAHPGLGNAVAHRLARRPDLADRLVGVAGDLAPARVALGPRFLLGLLSA